MSARSSSLRIETPEGVVFSFQLATPVARSLAWAVDATVVIAASVAIGRAAGMLGALGKSWGRDWAAAASVLFYFVVSMGYPMALEWFWRGQTIGKRLLRLRVVDAHGLRLQFTQVALRNLLRAIDFLPLFYLVGAVACLCSRKAQRLGDLAANTVVLQEADLREPDLETVAPVKYNSLLTHPHLTARLRDRVSPEVTALAMRALQLRDGYAAIARVQLFGELASYFRGLAPYPEETTEALSDEQYVSSVVHAIYASRRSQ